MISENREQRTKNKRSFTLIDVLIGVALTLIVFLGIFGAFQLGLKVIDQSRNRIVATTVANGRIEMIRNLSYSSIGTKGAVLPYAEGILDVATTTTLNNVEYNVETQVKYISDSADGIGAEDTCDLDYKRAEVKVSWPGRFGGEVKLVTDVASKNKAEELSSCEAQPAGVLSVSVFDAYGQMVESALIEIFDPETGILIDSSYTPPSGKYDFPLATSTYKVIVSRSGFSTDRTYGTNEVATPEKPHPVVLEGQLTEISFSIDDVSTFSVDTLSPWGTDDFSDSFNDESKISELSNVLVSEGEINLVSANGGYVSSGYLISTSTTPQNLISWNEFSWTDSEPLNADLKYKIYYASGTDWYLIPDSDLAGNSGGFDDWPVDLSGLSTTTYTQLKLRANFSTDDSATSSTLYDWQVSWITSEAVPIRNLTFLLEGAKIIGTDGDENPVYKYSTTSTSDSGGHVDISNLEWDSYTFSIDPGLDLISTDPSPQPINLLPDGVIQPVSLYFEAENSLFLTIKNITTLEPIFAATATLSNIGLGYDTTQYTNEKGQTYFIPLEIANYDLEVQAPGYSATSTIVSVSGDVTETVLLEQVE